MASSKPAKFVQIANSSAAIEGRLYTVVNALDEEGYVWQYHPDERTTPKGKWIRLPDERE
jgi:hypothetical protein